MALLSRAFDGSFKYPLATSNNVAHHQSLPLNSTLCAAPDTKHFQLPGAPVENAEDGVLAAADGATKVADDNRGKLFIGGRSFFFFWLGEMRLLASRYSMVG